MSPICKTVARLSAWVDRLARWCAYASAAGIFAIAALLTISSLKRYVFLTPIPETEELGGLMFMASTFLAIAYGLTQDRHVRLVLLWNYLPGRWRDAASLVGYLLLMASLGVLISLTWTNAIGSYEEQNRTVMTEILLWPWRMIIPTTLAVVWVAAAVRFSALSLSITNFCRTSGEGR
ncbi:MAG: TRAP transporter small permease subunit [Proteobacteria bacterium]|nr:TRAP transporter small permease subunit [Pseudomonadota bacterium]